MSSEAKKSSDTSLYRRIEARMWGDERFRALSRMPASGQSLFIYLLTGPQLGPIPGLYSAGRAALAESLQWSQESFDESFAELFRERLAKADWNARVVWVPKAIKHNKPANPNIVLSWSRPFDLIPECPLKWEAREALRASLHAAGDSFGNAFDKACPNRSGNGLPNGLANGMPNQEQEQEQEQKINTPLPPKGGKRVRSQSGEIDPEGFAAWYEHYRRKDARADAVKAWRQLNPDLELQTRMIAALAVWRWSDDRSRIPLPASWIRGRRWEDEAVTKALGQQAAGPKWWLDAGFEHPAEAHNEGCHAGNYREFRDGKRVASEATA